MNTPRRLTIRRYVDTDWARLCAIHDSSRKDELAASGLLDAFLTLEQTAENEGLFAGDVLVGEDSGKVQGFVAFADHELNWLYVDPAAYHQGIGRTLLRAAIEACGGTLSTEVLVGNDAALQLYLSEGFQVVKRVDGRLTGHEAFAASGYLLQRTASVMPDGLPGVSALQHGGGSGST
jgi:ribosomal protein S18 acetylase RimI-like enzyme